jgi:hypothetical protein
MDASLANFTPHGVDWFDPIASPINLAMRDLKRDWQKVLGVPPTVLSSLPQGAWDGDCIVYFALAAPGPQHEESFTVAASQAPGSNACLLTVTGGGIRGLIYGIFQVSADFLGVDPMWWFSDLPPVYEPAGVAVAPSYSYDSGEPAFNSRGGEWCGQVVSLF